MNLLLFICLQFSPIQETIPDGSFSYPGLNPREILIVDRKNSPLLEKSYQDLLASLKERKMEKEILLHLLYYVRETLFDPNLCNMENVATLIQALHPDELEPEIPLDFFLKQRTGVCRHMALTTAYIIDRLISDGWLKGQSLLIRENIPSGRHAWTLFLSEEGAWHLDASWGFLADGKTEEGFLHLCQYYGKQVMLKQNKRWSSDD